MTEKKQRTWVFTPLDLLIPWGVCLLAAIICLVVMMSGKVQGDTNPLIPKIITGVVGAMFLAAIPLWYLVRSRLRKFHYKTKHGLYVCLGKKNQPSQLFVEQWTNEVIDHWTTKFRPGHPLTKDQVIAAFSGMSIFFVDQEKLSVMGRAVRGYSDHKDIVIGYKEGSLGYPHSLFKHELSHPVLGNNGVAWEEKLHHDTFASTGLGA